MSEASPARAGAGQGSPARRRSLAVQAMVLVGGMAALSWEVVWQLQASLAFGVSALGTVLTLAATMTGVAAGAFVAGNRLHGRRVDRSLRLYGRLELTIGLAGLLALPGFHGLEILDAWAYARSPVLAPLLHAAGMALLLAPASLAMGATVPVFQGVARSHGTRVSTLYAVNTAGAALGVLLLSFWLLPNLGVLRSCLLVASLNAGIWLLSHAPSPAPAAGEDEHDAKPPARTADGPRLSPALAQAVVLCTGFATFGLEVAWFRALRAAFWSTSGTFAVMLAAVLVPLAGGARLVPWLRRIGVAPGSLLAFAGAAILVSTPFIERMDLMIAGSGAYPSVLGSWLLLTMAVVGPAMLCLATALPWCLEEFPEPGMTGRLYGLNTLGSVTGTLVAGWLLLPVLGFARSAWLLGLLVLAVALLAGRTRRRWAIAAAGAASLLVAVAEASSPGRDRPQGRTEYHGQRVLALQEGPDFTTSVLERTDGTRSLLIDGFASTGENGIIHHYMAWMGSLPALLHPHPKRGLVICFGTGQTANALRQEGIEELDVVEVSQAVFDLAHFFRSNQAVLEDPRVRAITMDGRAWLRRTQRRYDVITLEPMPPNFSGVNSLYSLEFYRIMELRLAAGGVVAQWLPIHLLSPRHAASVTATFRAVFGDAILWYDPVGGTGILLGRRAGGAEPLGTSWPGLERRSVARNLSPEQIRRGVFLEADALARYASAGTLITDDNQLLQFSDMHGGLSPEWAIRRLRANLALLSDAAGREPFRLAPLVGQAGASGRTTNPGSTRTSESIPGDPGR